MMLIAKLTSFFAVVTIGLLAGVMLGVAMEQQTAQHLTGDCWIVRQNLNDRAFRLFMPATFAVTVASSLIATFLLHHTSRAWMGAACLTSAIVIGITVLLEVPLNNTMETWQATNLPATWQITRDLWLHNHWLRTWFGIGSFVCSTVSMYVQTTALSQSHSR